MDIIRVVNSNPNIIKFAIKWFNETCDVPMQNFAVRLHLYPDNNIPESILYWSKFLGIPSSQFQKAQIDTRKDKKAFRKGKLPFGTAHLTVKSMGDKKLGSFFARKINAWIEEVLCG